MGNKIIIQDKDLKGEIPATEIRDVTSKFKQIYFACKGDKREHVIGFELNGGTGLTELAQEEWNEFLRWCNENGLNAIYNTYEEVKDIILNLRERIRCINIEESIN